MNKSEFIKEFFSKNSKDGIVDIAPEDISKKFGISVNYIYMIAGEYGYIFRSSREIKEQMLAGQMRALAKDGVLYYTRKEFIKQYGGCYRTVKRIADREGFIFKDPDRSAHYKKLKRTEQNIKKITEILKAGSATYKEIGDALGISRQRAEQIIKKHGIRKQAKYRGQSMKTVEKIVYALDHLPYGRDISATAFAKEAGVDYASLMKYINRLSADDKRAVAFNDCFRKDEPVKADKIRELLKTTDLSCTEIARHMGSPISYVSRINRNENIRPSRRGKSSIATKKEEK